MRAYFSIALFLFSLIACQNTQQPKEHIAKEADTESGISPQAAPITLVIHGGAGNITRENIPEERQQEYTAKLEEALNTGYAVLDSGGTSLDAVVATIQVMEASPLFNAGRGAVFANNGKNELDASIMDGATGNAGAVAGVTTIKSPILAARTVMDKSPHVLMAREGAEKFAEENGLEMVDPSYFYEERRFKQMEGIRERENETAYLEKYPDYKFGTVGCVALDKEGNIAAGTSTGGMTNKRWGRIGDSPIIGAGTFAENASCGVSGTGHGEFFIRNVVAYDIAALIKYKNYPLKEAAHEVVMQKLKQQKASGGVIALDRKGNVTMPFNTSGMFRGYIKEKGKPQTWMFRED